MPKTKPELLDRRRGECLMDVRHALGRTQTTMARAMLVHPTTLASWEGAGRPMPAHRLDQLRAIVEDCPGFSMKQRREWRKRIEAVR